MKFRIPKGYDQGGRHFVVNWVEKCRVNKKSADGSVSIKKSIIEIEKNDKNTADHNLYIFIHEWFHSTLWTCGELKLYEDEDFVTRIANSLHQSIKTMD
jgi:hypothetical protein